MLCLKAGRLEGRFQSPPSKPMSQRYLLAAALAEGETEITRIEWSDDVVATARAVQPISSILIKGDRAVVSRREPDFYRAFNVGESGFTLRTAVSVYAGIPGLTAVYFGGTLRGRPIDELIEVLRKLTEVVKLPGAVIIKGKELGRLEVEIRADISSQYISGLMFLAAVGSGGVIKPLGERKSWSFVEATAEVLRAFRAEVKLGEYIEVGGRMKSPGKLAVPGDFSLSAFLVVAGVATGGEVEIRGPLSKLDEPLVNAFKAMGVDITTGEGWVRAKGGFYRGIDVNLSDNPDLVMPTALAAGMVEEESTIRGVETLRYKESNRIATVIDVLERLGVQVRHEKDAIYIKGPPKRRDVAFSSHGDHRIGLMALAASKIVGGCVDDISPVAKSWPAAVLYFISE
ncbi:3-phosphoshikimate 1-carboxyvinyltransferase [Pyrobaculum aerophilum]|uniref:3-phosphoshikimate 1-carboxyvinyltransferase n=2 Tax=Pyrobaculum aerophilum TaxID=13773 RepID=Q8ZW81_PYRAE|nr:MULTISPECIES: 3-phosphoshikimate 1-carboxyvinyltransferase [Pyrobaculum]AAL63821.1 3-phosphoshikimate 1-carboxyvinyltransferase (aroA) [Pyrobaculum aerophilum str. IM2]MCX8136734.1 3-phosphoshikimate 1-carboxyvinyltransferase [Pyrobaculum aerophilum]HII46643.1 3-phosphoshikimate 1-carboxyvinyltransferase [Pyrobaculum aerophilum]